MTAQKKLTMHSVKEVNMKIDRICVDKTSHFKNDDDYGSTALVKCIMLLGLILFQPLVKYLKIKVSNTQE